jgi:hypothetical protein
VGLEGGEILRTAISARWSSLCCSPSGLLGWGSPSWWGLLLRGLGRALGSSIRGLLLLLRRWSRYESTGIGRGKAAAIATVHRAGMGRHGAQRRQ